MRRDVYIENDSGGFSVLAAAAADAIIEDGREDDERFVDAHQAMLLMLYGDDSLPVRVVVDEPLSQEEEAQWLGRVSGRIDLPDGRLLVMGGFDPDVLDWWRDAGDPDADGRGIGVVQAGPGSWRVDVYAHVGSMNGRATLDEGPEPIGTFFRRSHPGRGVPSWLANMLEFSGGDDPGHEELWSDVPGAIEHGELELDTGIASAVGFLVHLTPFDGEAPPKPEGGWFDYDDGRRIPDVFPVGIPAEVPDPDIESFLDRALRREKPEEESPAATEVVEIIEAWPGDPLAKLEGDGVTIAPTAIHQLYWIAGLAADSSPAFELWIEADDWTPPAPIPEFGVVQKKSGVWALGTPPNSGGWFPWWGIGELANALGDVPDGATLDLAMAPRLWDDDELDPAVGRLLFSGTVVDGEWRITEVSPAIDAGTLEEALGFMRVLDAGYITVREGPERAAFDKVAGMYAPMLGGLTWAGDERVALVEPDERGLWMLAGPVFRARFSDRIACDPEDEDDD